MVVNNQNEIKEPIVLIPLPKKSYYNPSPASPDPRTNMSSNPNISIKSKPAKLASLIQIDNLPISIYFRMSDIA